MELKTLWTLFFVALIVVFVPDVFADNVIIPGGGGDGVSEINEKATEIANKGKLVIGVLIGAAGLVSAGIGAFNYTLRRWREGHGWMIGAGVGIVTGGLITAYASFMAS